MSDRLRLLLLRHGTAVAGPPDPGLSAEGRSGVDASLRHPRLADWFRLDLLLYSPLRRAVETAERVAVRLAPVHARAVPELLPDTDADISGRLLIRAVSAAAFPEAVPDTHAASSELRDELRDTHADPREAPEGDGCPPARRVCVVGHLPLLPALGRWLCDAELDFATGCGWVLEGDPGLAWQGTFSRIGRVDHGGMW